MEEYKDIVTMKGGPLTLTGSKVEVGQQAPDFEVLNSELSPVKLSAFAGKICIISAVPSIDTSVCDVQTRRFNQEAQKIGNDVHILTISMDLPFAQERWCGAAGVENLEMLSDYRDASFGRAFGVLIKELRLLARSIFVIDKEGVIHYIEIVPELTHEPDYEAAINAAKQLI